MSEGGRRGALDGEGVEDWVGRHGGAAAVLRVASIDAAARAVSAVAHDHEATADRAAVQEVQRAVAARPADVDVAFWGAPRWVTSRRPTTTAATRSGTARRCGSWSWTGPGRGGT